MKKVLVIAPHPDDETLGCGGTILKHRKNKDEVNWCIITLGNKDMGHDENHMNLWKNIILKTQKQFGIKRVFKLGYPTGGLDQVPLFKLVNSIKNVIKKTNPETVYINFSHDIHSDHQIVFNAVMSSVKSFNFPKIKRILMYETISETEFAANLENKSFNPNYFIDISPYLEKKLSIFKNYKTEIMKENLPRSISNIKALAKFRGSRIGKKYAEAFVLVLGIE